MPDGPTQKNPGEGIEIGRPEVQPEHPEVRPLKPRERPSQEEQTIVGVPIAGVPQSAPVPVSQKSTLLQGIENILEENILPLYKELSPKQRQQFKAEGERTARKIEQLLKKARVAIIEIIRLIRTWLRLIPGINIFFLEQEAKIKAERIIELKEEQKPSVHE